METSPFKVCIITMEDHLLKYMCTQDDLIAEAGILFCNTLSREPNKKDVKVCMKFFSYYI